MRIGYRKQIGKSGVYVGSSVSTKKLGKGLWSIILLPFYLVYYVCIWPFVALYRALTKKSRMQRAADTENARTLAPQYLRIIQESSKLVSDTKSPEVFFSRYDLLVETLEKFAEIENSSPLTGDKPSEILPQTIAAREKATDDFIVRYATTTRMKIYKLTTDKAKRNNAEAFKKILGEYSEKMTEKNLQTIEAEYQKIINAL